MVPNDAVWFISGCSTGFGRLLAERAWSLGYRVVATARSTQSLGDLGEGDRERILRLELDVRDRSQVRQTVATTLERFGQVDVLINNAGYGYFATQEEGELEEIRSLFETNVFGLISVTQELLPVMRRQRSGVVVNMSSVAGRITTPRGGFYQASKWSVEALSEALWLETSELGLRVIIVEPGSYDTDFGPRSARTSAADTDPSSPYAELRELWKENAGRAIFPRRQDPAEVIDAVVDAVRSDLSFVRLPVGRDATTIIERRREMGDRRFLDWMRDTYYEKGA